MKPVTFLLVVLGCFSVLVFASTIPYFTMPGISGHDLCPGCMILTIDDGPSVSGPDGSNNLRIVIKGGGPENENGLDQLGVPSVAFLVPCNFAGTPPGAPGTTMCQAGYGTVPESLIDEMDDSGNHLIGNHSFSHIDEGAMGSIMQNYQGVRFEVALAQMVLDRHPNALDIHAFRFPYYSGGANEIKDILATGPLLYFNINPLGGPGFKIDIGAIDLSRLTGPVNGDTGSGPYLGTPNGGDWQCWLDKITAQACVDRDMSAIDPDFKGIITVHIRTEYYSGADGDPWPKDFILGLAKRLISERKKLLPFDSLVLGNIQASNPERVSSEFGIGNGDGRIVFGDLGGTGYSHACKAFGTVIKCMGYQKPSRLTRTFGFLGLTKSGSFEPSTPWFDVADQTWITSFGQKFWLVDVNGDGKKDLLVPMKDGLLPAYSNGFNQFIRLPLWKPTLPPGSSLASLVPSLAFADINGDGKDDMLGIFGNNILWWPAGENGFNTYKTLAALPPAIDWSDPKYGSTLLVGDVNGDRFPDLVIRGPLDVFVSLGSSSGFSSFTSWSRRFPDWQGFDDPASYTTLALMRLDGRMALCTGLTSGIACHQADENGKQRFRVYRYLNNSDFTILSDPNWHPERHGEGLAFPVLESAATASPTWMKSDGLYTAPIRKIAGRTADGHH